MLSIFLFQCTATLLMRQLVNSPNYGSYGCSLSLPLLNLAIKGSRQLQPSHNFESSAWVIYQYNLDSWSLTEKATTLLVELVNLRCLGLTGRGRLTDDIVIPLKELYNLRELDLCIASSLPRWQKTYEQGGILPW